MVKLDLGRNENDRYKDDISNNKLKIQNDRIIAEKQMALDLTLALVNNKDSSDVDSAIMTYKKIYAAINK